MGLALSGVKEEREMNKLVLFLAILSVSASANADLFPLHYINRMQQVLARRNRENPPKLLHANFFKKDEVCRDARANDPRKRLAVVLLKTHNCDVGTAVCMDSLSTFSDPANVFLKDNFATYHTRFTSYSLSQPIKNFRMGSLDYSSFPKEDQIRAEWGKEDSNPQLLVVDTQSCTVLGSRYMYDHPDSFRMNFHRRYLAMREILLSIPGVKERLPFDSQNPRYLTYEMDEIRNARLTHRETSMTDAFRLLVSQAKDAGMEPLHKGSQHTYTADPEELRSTIRKEDPGAQVFVTSRPAGGIR
jgi:hypothetical protein